jgi:hypothetical protein
MTAPKDTASSLEQCGGEPSLPLLFVPLSSQSEACRNNVLDSRILHIQRGRQEPECGQKAIKLRTKVLFYGLKIKRPETLDSVRF